MKNEATDSFARITNQAREAIDAARDTQESTRATRRRLRLQGLILSWRRRPSPQPAVESERLALILDAVRSEADAPMGNIQVFADGALRIRTASSTLPPAFLAHFAEVRTGESACGAAFRDAAPVIVDDVSTSPLFGAPDRDVLLATGIRACQSLALVRDGRKLGVISLHYREAHIPPRRQVAFTSLAPDIAEAVSLALCT